MNGDAGVADARRLSFLRRAKRTTLGRSSPLSPQPHQSVAASLERAELPDVLRAARRAAPASRRSSAGSSRCGHGRSGTSSSSRRTSTRSTSSRTSTRKRSRSATTCGARSCCCRSGRCRRSLLSLDPDARSGCSTRTPTGSASSTTSRSCGSCSAAAGLLFRTVQLFFIRSVQTGLVWCTKILTDPFHDVQLYHKSPALPAARRAHRSDAPRARRRRCAEQSPRTTRSPTKAGSSRPADGRRAAAPEPHGQHLAQDRAANRLVVGAGAVHHQPSASIASAAATKRSATARKSASV